MAVEKSCHIQEFRILAGGWVSRTWYCGLKLDCGTSLGSQVDTMDLYQPTLSLETSFSGLAFLTVVAS